LRQFCSLLHGHLAAARASSAHTVGSFLVVIGADHFDLPALHQFLESTELPRKIRGFVDALRFGQKASSSTVYALAELLSALVGSTGDDRILFTPTDGASQASVRYLSLDAEARFRDLVNQARTVIFAGGTLEPRAEFAPLYAQTGSSVLHFSGQHVVPPSHIFARYVTHGPEGHPLDFRKDIRSTREQLSELRDILRNATAASPGGTIFFFPSFDYLSSVAPPAGSRLGGRQVFVESRGGAGGESSFDCFAAAVRRDGGALLLAVNGGKLSEGIDFKDDLCRLVGVVGLPYPNSADLGLIEKMRFLDSCRAKGLPGLTGREYYSARCMKGVNQCVGRAIRHAGDWAAVLLLDHRYAQPAIHNAISQWLCEQAAAARFTETATALRTFYARHAGAQSL